MASLTARIEMATNEFQKLQNGASPPGPRSCSMLRSSSPQVSSPEERIQASRWGRGKALKLTGASLPHHVLAADLTKAVEARQRLDSQKSENDGVLQVQLLEREREARPDG